MLKTNSTGTNCNNNEEKKSDYYNVKYIVIIISNNARDRKITRLLNEEKEELKKCILLIFNMNKENKHVVHLVDLPEPVLDLILERLLPLDLYRLSRVSTSLKRRCRSDYLWKKLVEQKWASLISSNDWLLTNDSAMAYYLSLESGNRSFVAQVYGQQGFAMSCYDAQVTYNCNKDNFNARYPSERGGYLRASEIDVSWDRLRKLPVINVSDCVVDLKPGDHIETHWSMIKEVPYGWWYGVIGHLSSCEESVSNCQCQNSDNLILEFKQYPVRSIYRKVVVSRKHYREAGNIREGYYREIRRLIDEEEIKRWKTFWPPEDDFHPEMFPFHAIIN